MEEEYLQFPSSIHFNFISDQFQIKYKHTHTYPKDSQTDSQWNEIICKNIDQDMERAFIRYLIGIMVNVVTDCGKDDDEEQMIEYTIQYRQ